MPRTGPRRPQVAFRLAEPVADYVDQLALAEGLVKGDGQPNRSAMLRLLLAFAVEHWRPGWRPTRRR